MIHWIKVLLGIDIAESSIQGLFGRIEHDINPRMEHLAKRMDEAEILLKRIRSHVGYHG